MRHSTLAVAVSLCLLPHVLFAAPAGDELRKQVAQAAEQNSAASAKTLCGLLVQVLSQVNSAGKNIDALRDYEDIQWSIQEALAKQQAPEARAVLVGGMASLPQQAQVNVILALKEQPRSPELAKAALSLLKSTQNIQVQVALLDLLGEHRVVESAPQAAKLLDHNKLVMVQIAACRALARIPAKESIPPLIEYLAKNKGGRMRHEAVCALRALSGQAFGPDAGSWRSWWANQGAAFTPPAEPQPDFNYELKVENGEDPAYYSIPVIENRIVFVIDTSGSMKLGGSPNRWERARDELKKLIDQLNPRVQFNIVQYSTKVAVWQEYPGLVPATTQAKQAAKDFLGKLEPGGTTETTGALEKALREIALTQGVETVYLLSDGAPNPMRFSGVRSMTDYQRGLTDIQERMRLINQSLKIRIHTIGVYTTGAADPGNAAGATEASAELMKGFLENLAKENDGIYQDVK